MSEAEAAMWEALVGVGGLVLIAALGTLASAAARRERKVRRKIADAIGLRNVEVSLADGRIEGDYEGFRVRLEAVDPSRSWHYEEPSGTPMRWRGDRVTVLARGRIPHDVELRAESRRTRSESQHGRQEIEIGDEAFDAQVCVRGPELLLRAALDAPTRSRVRDFVAQGGRVVQGELVIESPSDETPTIGLIRETVTLARCLLPAEDVGARLCEIARIDPLPEVRVQALRTLVTRVADPRVRGVFREALRADDAEERLQAALALGDEGRETLAGLAERTEGDNRQAVQALEALGDHLPAERTLAILKDALRTGHRQVALAALAALGRTGGPEAVSRLATVLTTADVELALAASRALVATRDGTAEAALVRALSRSEIDVRVAAAEALGTVGATTAVAPLRQVLDSPDGSRRLSRAARQAIAAIRARVPGASPGNVSLADGEGGRLSLASDHPAGRVSLVKRTPGTQ